MKKYLAVELIDAEPQTGYEAYCEANGEGALSIEEFEEQGGENGEGYKIVYVDGSMSWYPKAIFETICRPLEEVVLHGKSDKEVFVVIEEEWIDIKLDEQTDEDSL
jgi:hypothetical protein